VAVRESVEAIVKLTWFRNSSVDTTCFVTVVTGNSKVLPCRERSASNQDGAPNVRLMSVNMADLTLSKAPLRFVQALLLILAFFSSGVLGQSEDADPEIIQAGDLVDIDVIGSIEFDWRGGLTPDGFLGGLDEIDGPIQALCRSTRELAVEIERVLSTILREPKVVVTIIDRSGRPMTRFDGAIKNPSRFVVGRPVRLLELITLAGGITDEASGEITIFRPGNAACSGGQNNSSLSMSIKLTDVIKGSPDASPFILSGDLVEVQRSLPVYVFGAVTAPRTLVYREGMTLTRAIDAAGGPLRSADGGRMVIMRRDAGLMRTIVVERAWSKKAEIKDEELKAFDIIIVSAKGDQELKYPPVLPGPAGTKPDGELPVRVID
jgi:protein involved in polysaccharide export with SLBB domain